jgi:hypothetical protein
LAPNAEHPAALDAHGFRHGPVAASRAHEGERDAGVAVGGLHNFNPRSQHTARFRVADHGSADAALDRVGRVATLYFGKHGCLGSGGDAPELHEGSSTNGQGVVIVEHVELL